MKKIFYFSMLAAIMIVASCSKDKKINPDGNVPATTGSTLDFIKDSVFLYAQQVYYWNESLPSYSAFKPRAFKGSSDIEALQTEIDAMTQYSKNPDNNNLPYEYYKDSNGSAKYSFIDDGTVSGELNGVRGDFGFAPIWIDDNDIRVKYVYPGSPADVKGLKRGYQIVAINGRTGTGLTYDGDGPGTNVNFLINAYSNSSNITLTLKRPDNTTFDVTMSTGTYTVNPVLTYKVVDAGNGKKIGYIAFNSFTSLNNAKPKIDEAFAAFAGQGVNNLVVDLRYNGGGFVETAQYLSNVIAPKSQEGKTMFIYHFNKTMADNKATILKNQVRKDPDTGEIYNYFDSFSYTDKDNTKQFSKAGVPTDLNLNNVFFIVTGSTASASELTINNLLPISGLNVKLIGTTSYGKPVGFFDIDINKYQMYIPEFETVNSNNQGRYYTGMTPGSAKYAGKLAGDDVTREFGDPTEGLFALAINYVKSNTFSLPQQQIQSLSRIKTFSLDQSREVGLKLERKEFKGMIYKNRKTIR